MPNITPKECYQSGLYATQVAAYFSKREILKLIEAEMIDKVQEVYQRETQELNTSSLDYNSKLAEAYGIVKGLGVEMPPLPTNAFDFYYWLDQFHREVITKLENDSPEQKTFFYGYDLGYLYTHAEQLRFVTEMEYELPMQLSYAKQSQHIIRQMNNTLNRLDAHTKTLVQDQGMMVLSDQWPTISTIIDSIHALDFMNVEHMHLYHQEKALADIVVRLDEVGDSIYRGL